MLLSFISVLVLSIRGRKVILNVSDLWPLAAIELEALKSGSLSHKLSLLLEKFIYRKSTLILGQSEEIIAHINLIAAEKKCFLYRNFPDHGAVDVPDVAQNNAPIKLFYAGLLGVAQGVFDVCKKMDLQNLNIEFHIFGDGAEKILIETFIKQHPEKEIHFHGMLERKELIKTLRTFDVALVPLKTRIYGSVPSKIFEYGALGIPTLYFGGGEGEKIVNENNLGWVANVGNFTDLNHKLIDISKLGKEKISGMKRKILEHSAHQFNLDVQIRSLIEKGVF